MTDIVRRRLTATLAFAAVTPGLAARAAGRPMEVWTGPGCSCCHDWVRHLQANGFSVTTQDGGNIDARTRLGMPTQFGSCHTGAVDGYAIEGHVPAREIHRLLGERPDAIGLSVPAMPRGSPGMDGPVYGGAHDPYDVLLIHRDGTALLYQSYRDGATGTTQAQLTHHNAQGTIESIDREAGTVTIAHGPVASMSWPAMTMSFKLADADHVRDLSPGQRVEFQFAVEGGMNATVTHLAKIER